MEVSGKILDGALVIAMPPRIDTTNANEAEEAITAVIDANGEFDKLVLDCDKMEYISSVGLRVLLRLKKAHDEFELINVSSDVYDILDMTGFTSMMDVQKAYRVVSIEGCPLIGSGYFGRVYRISPDSIVKMYFRTPGTAMPLKERQRAKMAFVLGIPTAISYEVVKIAGTEDTYGSIFELVDAESMDGIMKAHPERDEEMGKIYAGLMKTIFDTKVNPSELPSYKDYTHEWLDVISPHLGPEISEKVAKLLDSIPDDNYLIHGDCHMKNIFVSNGEPILIDMETISRGNHIFEYAPVYGSFFIYEIAHPGNDLAFFGLPFEVCKPFFENALAHVYPNLSDEEREQVYLQLGFVAACLILYRALSFTPDDNDLIDTSTKIIKEGVEKLEKLGLK